MDNDAPIYGQTLAHIWTNACPYMDNGAPIYGHDSCLLVDIYEHRHWPTGVGEEGNNFTSGGCSKRRKRKTRKYELSRPAPNQARAGSRLAADAAGIRDWGSGIGKRRSSEQRGGMCGELVCRGRQVKCAAGGGGVGGRIGGERVGYDPSEILRYGPLRQSCRFCYTIRIHPQRIFQCGARPGQPGLSICGAV